MRCAPTILRRTSRSRRRDGGGKRKRTMPRKEGVSTILCGVALLLSQASGNALDIDAKSFRCITNMTPVRQFYVDNLRGNLDGTLATANSPRGAVYPLAFVEQTVASSQASTDPEVLLSASKSTEPDGLEVGNDNFGVDAESGWERFRRAKRANYVELLSRGVFVRYSLTTLERIRRHCMRVH